MKESQLLKEESTKKINELEKELKSKQTILEKENKQNLLKQRTNNVLSEKIAELENMLVSVKDRESQWKGKFLKLDQRMMHEADKMLELENMIKRSEKLNKT